MSVEAGQHFEVIVPASTSNLGSGFDTLSAALSLYLRVEVEVIPQREILWTGWDGNSEDNILNRALIVAADSLGVRLPGLRIRMHNAIPLQRGLGSSGAAIIAGILISQTLSGSEISREEILEMAYPLEGHPDNLAASLFGGWVISRLSGKRVAAESIQSLVRCKFVVVVPSLRISTAQAREILPESYSLGQAAFNLQRNALMIHALHTGETHLIREAVADQLHQPFRAELVPGLASLLERENLPSELDDALYGVSISGSGSTVLGLTGGSEDQVAEWMVESLAKAGTEAVPMVLELDRVGARVVTS